MTVNNHNTRRGRRPQLPSLKPLSYAVLCVMHGLLPVQAMALENPPNFALKRQPISMHFCITPLVWVRNFLAVQ